MVHWLLQQPALRARVNEQDTVGQTALHLGARKSGREMCRRLLEAGASPAAADAKGMTPEAAATKEGRRSNAGFLRWHARLPAWLGRQVVSRGAGGRAFVVCPTPHGAIAAGCIALAYLYYAAVLLPGTSGAGLAAAHWALALATAPMVACFLLAWKGDPGLIPAQPAAVIAGLVSGELGVEDLVMPAVSPKYPRAKFSRFFNCYVARLPPNPTQPNPTQPTRAPHSVARGRGRAHWGSGAAGLREAARARATPPPPRGSRLGRLTERIWFYPAQCGSRAAGVLERIRTARTRNTRRHGQVPGRF